MTQVSVESVVDLSPAFQSDAREFISRILKVKGCQVTMINGSKATCRPPTHELGVILVHSRIAGPHAKKNVEHAVARWEQWQMDNKKEEPIPYLDPGRSQYEAAQKEISMTESAANRDPSKVIVREYPHIVRKGELSEYESPSIMEREYEDGHITYFCRFCKRGDWLLIDSASTHYNHSDSHPTIDGSTHLPYPDGRTHGDVKAARKAAKNSAFVSPNVENFALTPPAATISPEPKPIFTAASQKLVIELELPITDDGFLTAFKKIVDACASQQSSTALAAMSARAEKAERKYTNLRTAIGMAEEDNEREDSA